MSEPTKGGRLRRPPFLTVGELRKRLAAHDSDTPVAVPGHDHSYRLLNGNSCGAAVAVFYDDGTVGEDFGLGNEPLGPFETEDFKGRRVEILVIR